MERSLDGKMLPVVLSVTAGSVDVISFLGLGGLFAAHVTGNLVILAAHIATGRAASLSHILSVPVFVSVLLFARLLASGLEKKHRGSLAPLLTLQLALLGCFMAVRVAGGSDLDPAGPIAVVAGLLGVAAMAVQNGLVQISSVGAPATAVMTTDITILMIDVGTLLLQPDADRVAFARHRARRTWPRIVGFNVGGSLGAILQAAMGPWSLALPTGLALLALALGVSIESEGTCAE